MPTRAALATRATTAVNWLSRRVGAGAGTVAGGRVGLAIDPNLLGRLLAGREVFLVSGTNGKTTTAALLRAALGEMTAGNDTGSNMPPGHVAALAASRAEKVVLEVDEAWLAAVLDASRDARCRTVALLNLSRDQLDRASEVRQVAERWRGALLDAQVAGPLTVVANVNDPLVAYAAEAVQGLVPVAAPVAWLGDARSCPRCTRPIQYGTDGQWICDCGLVRPVPVAVATEEIEFKGESVELPTSLPGDFNRANSALAIVAAATSGVDLAVAAARVSEVTEVVGRFALRRWRGRTFRVMLAKNPAGVAALLGTLSDNGDVVVAINDLVADGRDPSWLYDAPFDALRGRRVWCEGSRALDLATRLECDEVDCSLAEDHADYPAPIKAQDPVDVVANYTAFADWLKRSDSP
jgi:UDP-N-acetylmuramyl tripeptide synthase